jgi:hypothetical protein
VGTEEYFDAVQWGRRNSKNNLIRQKNIFEMIIKTEIMIQLLRVSCEIISKLKNGQLSLQVQIIPYANNAISGIT